MEGRIRIGEAKEETWRNDSRVSMHPSVANKSHSFDDIPSVED